MSPKYIYVALLIFGTALWGISFPLTKIAIGDFSQHTFLLYRFIGATAAIFIIFRKQVKQIDSKALKAGILFSIPLILGINLQTLGIVKHVSASQCAFVAGLCVIIVPLLKVWLYDTKIKMKTWICSFLSLLGLGIISLTNSFDINIADLYTLMGALGFAIYLVLVESYSKQNDIVPTLLPMFSSCAVWMLILSVGIQPTEWIPTDTKFWAGVVYCSIFTTAFMYSISNIAQKYIDSEKVAVIYLFDPIFATIASFILLDEVFTWRLAVGGSIIIIATLLTELNVKKAFRQIVKR